MGFNFTVRLLCYKINIESFLSSYHLQLDGGGPEILGFLFFMFSKNSLISSSSVQNSINTSDGVLGTLNFHLVDWLHESRGSCKDTGIKDTPGCWDNLTASTMDGDSMKSNIVQIKSDGPHVLVAQYSLL